MDKGKKHSPFDCLRQGGMLDAGAAILGDVVLDRYLMGTTARVSREAPIPVVICENETDNLGGAGNVAANLRGLGCRTFLAGAIGDDEGGRCVRKHLKMLDIQAQLFVRPYSTLTKTRLICGGQQVARFDHEHTVSLEDQHVQSALTWLEILLDKQALGAVILSDYGLGFCTPALCLSVIALARKAKVPVFVDPRGSDWSKYCGATVVTPNLAELGIAYGMPVLNEDKEVRHAAETVRKKAGIDFVLTTRSSRGMTLLGAEHIFYVPARPVEVYDVSGAGDTVIASLAASIASGFSFEESVRFANEAAQVVVTKSGTVPINIADLLQEHDKRNPELLPQRGSVSRRDAAAICSNWKKEGLKVIFTNGCFDILHAGHVNSLERAKKLGDRLIVGLNSDRSVKALKGESRPINSEQNRACLLAALRPVDLVVIFEEETPSLLLSELRPDVLVKGGDYKAEELPGREFVEEVVILPLISGLSTTLIVERTHGKNS